MGFRSARIYETPPSPAVFAPDFVKVARSHLCPILALGFDAWPAIIYPASTDDLKAWLFVS